MASSAIEIVLEIVIGASSVASVIEPEIYPFAFGAFIRSSSDA